MQKINKWIWSCKLCLSIFVHSKQTRLHVTLLSYLSNQISAEQRDSFWLLITRKKKKHFYIDLGKYIYGFMKRRCQTLRKRQRIKTICSPKTINMLISNWFSQTNTHTQKNLDQIINIFRNVSLFFCSVIKWILSCTCKATGLYELAGSGGHEK